MYQALVAIKIISNQTHELRSPTAINFNKKHLIFIKTREAPEFFLFKAILKNATMLHLDSTAGDIFHNR